MGQGALAVECRANDEATIKLLEPLYDLQTALRVTAERSFLKTLGGGCSAPVAISSELKIKKSNEIKVTLNGAVWSLDGVEEIQAKEEVNITVQNGLRCATCPYNNNKYIEDIESLSDCVKCPNSPTNEPSEKKKKLDIPNDILAVDPHEHCPIEIPIGADFMGKCPYLEGILASNVDKCPVSGSTDNINVLNYSKCLFLKDTMLNIKMDKAINNLVGTDQENIKLFCGLVLHKGATVEGMQNAKKLGEKLAQALISKGALEIMSKAQSIIHNSIGAGSN